MATINQLIGGLGEAKGVGKVDGILQNSPQKKAVILKLGTAKPKKPNSAIGKIAKVGIVSTNIPVIVYIPGQGHSLQEHAQLLIGGGRVPDLPGVHYKAIKGKLDFNATERFTGMNRGSKFGVKKIKLK